MTNLSQLAASHREAANHLRANSELNASEHSMPVAEAHFLRHAANCYEAVREEIVKDFFPLRCGKVRSLGQELQ